MRGCDQTSIVMLLEKVIQIFLALRLALGDFCLLHMRWPAASGGLYRLVIAIPVVVGWVGALHAMVRESEPKAGVTFSIVCGALVLQGGLARWEHPGLGLSTCAQHLNNGGS